MDPLRKALFGGVVCWSACVWSQGFNKRYDAFGQGFVQGSYGVERNAGGHAIFSGSFEPDTLGPDSIVGQYRIIITGIDGQGNMQWEKRYAVPEHWSFLGWADCCDSIPSGGFVIGGGTTSYENIVEARLVRFDAQGDSLWAKSFGSAGHYWIGEQVKRLADGGFAICGGTDATGDQDGFVIRTDADGNELWRQTYGWPDPIYVDGFTALIEEETGDLYMSGSRFLNADDSQHWVQRTTADGVLVWKVSWGGEFKEGATYVMAASDGFPVVVGGNGCGSSDQKRAYLAKIDTLDGDRIWEHEYGPVYFGNLLTAAKECPNADIIACGFTYEGGPEQGQLLRTTSNGDSLWLRKYWYHDDVIDQGEGRFWDVLPTDDGGFIASGFANGPYNSGFPPGYSQDAWVVKVDSMGCIVPGCQLLDGVTENVTNLGTALTLYPNPVHDVLHVGLQLPANYKTEGPLVLSVTSLDGKLVLQQAVPTSVAGEVLLEVGDLASGSYSIHLSDAHTWIAGKKFIIE